MTITAPILCYHHVGERYEPGEHRRLWVSAERFNQQMDCLHRGGYQTVTLQQFGVALAGQGTLPPRPVILTFDDAYSSFDQWAFEALRDRGFCATIFVVTGLAGGLSRWDADQPAPLMDWQTLGRLSEAGIECASHTVTHARLTDLSQGQVADELAASRQTLEKNLGVAVTTLAYPFGAYNTSIAAEAQCAGYTTACTIVRGNRHRAADHMALKRIPVDEYVKPKQLLRRLSRWYDLEWILHRFLRQCRGSKA